MKEVYEIPIEVTEGPVYNLEIETRPFGMCAVRILHQEEEKKAVDCQFDQPCTFLDAICSGRPVLMVADSAYLALISDDGPVKVQINSPKAMEGYVRPEHLLRLRAHLGKHMHQ